MDFRTFERKYSRYPVIKSTYFALEDNPAYIRRLVSEWIGKKWLIELRRGMYLLNTDHVFSVTERFHVANLLYEPSYLSLESALSFHGVIPEAVPQLTSVGTRKTAHFSNALGTFSYSAIKKTLFWGYKKYKLGQTQALIALPEKALLDLIYLRKGELRDADEVVESLRLDSMMVLNSKLLLSAAKRFDNSKVLQVARELSIQLRRRKP